MEYINYIQEVYNEEIPNDLLVLLEKIYSQPSNVRISAHLKQCHQNWLANYNYHFVNLRNEIPEKPHYGKVFKQNMIMDIRSATEEFARTLMKNVLVIAWNFECPEADTALYYDFDKNGSEGYHIYSLNFSEKPLFISKQLDEIVNTNFELSEKISSNGFDWIKLMAGTKNDRKELGEIVSSSNLYMGDTESIIEIDQYEELFNDLKKISSEIFDFESIILKEIDYRKGIIEVTTKDASYKLDVDDLRDFCCLPMTNFYTQILNGSKNTGYSFVEVRDPEWGQELAIAFVSDEVKNELDKRGFLGHRQG